MNLGQLWWVCGVGVTQEEEQLQKTPGKVNCKGETCGQRVSGSSEIRCPDPCGAGLAAGITGLAGVRTV